MIAYLAVPEQLHDTALIRRIPRDFTDDGVYERALGGAGALAVAGLGSALDGRRRVALVRPSRQVYISFKQAA